MRPVVIARWLCVLFVLVSTMVIVPWLRYRPLKDLAPAIAMTHPPPPETKSFVLKGEEVVYSERGTIPQTPWLFGPMLFGSMVSLAFVTISLLIEKRPSD